jgi:hypothetical protein
MINAGGEEGQSDWFVLAFPRTFQERQLRVRCADQRISGG